MFSFEIAFAQYFSSVFKMTWKYFLHKTTKQINKWTKKNFAFQYCLKLREEVLFIQKIVFISLKTFRCILWWRICSFLIKTRLSFFFVKYKWHPVFENRPKSSKWNNWNYPEQFLFDTWICEFFCLWRKQIFILYSSQELQNVIYGFLWRKTINIERPVWIHLKSIITPVMG